MSVHVAKIGDIIAAKAPDVLEALALGSCVSAIIYDPIAKVGVITHILLPEVSPYKQIDGVGKYADKAIPEAIRQVQKIGGLRDRLVSKIAGGAKMFDISTSVNIDVGERNIEAVKSALRKNGISIVAEDTGENYGRTVSFDIETSILTIKIGLKKITKRI